jgi:hypothetical protein
VTEETGFRLAPPRQVHVAGLALGVVAIKPIGEPTAVLGIFDPEAGEPRAHTVRPGDEVRVAGRTVLVGDIVAGDGGFVDLTVRWPRELP